MQFLLSGNLRVKIKPSYNHFFVGFLMIYKDLSNIPLLPGVYIFKDKNQNVIYIGKAKLLKHRIRNYFQENKDFKVSNILKESETLEHIITKSESEALLLEAHLINRYQPKHNVLLKDGQPFVYILFTSTKLPQIKLVRNKTQKGDYFGPFLKKTSAKQVYSFLTKAFKLKTCNKKIEHGCLDYHLGLCAGTCKKDFDKSLYLLRIKLAKSALHGKYKKTITEIEKHIKEHNERLEFEKSKHLSEILGHFKSIYESIKCGFSSNKFENEIFIATSPAKLPKYNKVSDELKKLFSLKTLPTTIDCFDISHFQGRDIVGSCIRFNNGKPDKNSFRRFKIKSLNNQNDCAALEEIVSRHYKKNEYPSLVLIDGGKGQRNTIKKIIPDVDVISLAKKEETLFSDNKPEGYTLDLKTDIGKLLVTLRDYAHHFAISYHRTIRKKGIRKG